MEHKSRATNQLVGRLYKNFSESKLTRKNSLPRDLSLLRGDFGHLEKDILVPSLSKISHHDSSTLKVFQHSRFPDISSIVSKNASNFVSHKKFNQIILDDSRVLTDELTRTESSGNLNKLKDKLKENKGRVVKKRAIIRSYNRAESQGTPQQELSLADFINLIKQEPDVSDEFCYLRVMSNPYDLRIVDYDQKSEEPALRDGRAAIFNKKTPLPSKSQNLSKITISARGITYLNRDQPVFITLEEWTREAELYNKLTSLSFFKQYRVWKNFCVWKKLLRRMTMRKVSQTLSHELLFADPHLRPSLLHARSLLLKVQSIRFYKVDQSQKEVPTHLEFNQEQERLRNTQLSRNITYLQQQVVSNVIEACGHSLKAFKQENRIGNTELGMGGRTEPLLIGDNSNKPMPYTEEATIKAHYQKLTKFMKLVDNLVIDGKLKLMLESVSYLRQTIHNQNASYYEDVIQTNQKLGYKGQQWFVCEMFFQSNKVTFNPDRAMLQNVFEELIDKGISQVCKKHRSIQEVQDLVPYLIKKQGEGEKSEDIVDLEQLVRYSSKFDQEYGNLVEEIDVAFDYAQNYSSRLTEFIEIYMANKQEDLQSYRYKDHEQIEKSIVRWKGENTKLNSIVQEHQSSMLLIQTGRLKDTIKSCAEVCLEQIYKLLPEMLKDKSSELKAQLVDYKQLIDSKPQNVQDFILLNQNVNSISNGVEDLSLKLSQVSDVFNLIKNNRSNMGESMQTLKTKEHRVNQLNHLMVSLRTKIDEANMNMSQMRNVFVEEISKIPPEISRSVEQKYRCVSDFDYNSPAQTIISFLDGQQQILEEMFEHNSKLNFYQKSLETDETTNEHLEEYSGYFKRVHKLYLYRQRMTQFASSLGATTLQSLDITNESEVFQFLDTDVSALNKEGCKQAETEARYSLSEKDRSLLDTLQEDVKSYLPVMRCLKAMKSGILKEREWDEIVSFLQSKSISSEVVNKLRNSVSTIDSLISSKIYKHWEFITEVTVRANQQAQLASILQKISLFWTSNYIQCCPYLQYKDVYMLEDNRELFARIDQCLVDLNVVLNSRYVDTVLTDAEKQNRLFTNLQELLEEWKIHQSNWLLLEPIFNNAYFKTFPKELKAFSIADNNWRKIMKVSKEYPAKKWAEQENALQTLRTNNAVYHNLKKLIPAFLQKKRQVFYRFYTISDQQLIQILSKCKDFKSVEPYLWKVFRSVDRFQYNQESQPSGLVNFDGEVLPLKMIRVNNEPEEIFKVLQDCMRQSVRSLIKHSSLALQKETFRRKDWLNEYPFHVVHLVDMIEWTKIIENDYLAAESDGDMSNLFYSQMLQLSETIQMLNSPSNCRNRKVLTSLLVQNIEYRDIVQKLVTDNIESTNDFYWLIQLKAYHQNQHYVVKQFQREIVYGYEFLKIFNKMPVCPQTSECRFALFQAVNSRCPLSLQGPVQIFQDLANVCGKNLVEASCNFTEPRHLSNIVKDGYTSGSWILFTDLSEQSLEMVSYIAKLVDVVRLSCQNKQGIQRTRQLGIAVNIKTTQPIPEAYRRELRSVAMMPPEQWFLLQIHLYKQGLSGAKQLVRELKLLVDKINTNQDIHISIPLLTSSLNLLQINPKLDNLAVMVDVLQFVKSHIEKHYNVQENDIALVFNEYLLPKKLCLTDTKLPETCVDDVAKQNPLVVYGHPARPDYNWVVDQYSKLNPQDSSHSNIMFVKGSRGYARQLLGRQQETGTEWSGPLQVFLQANNKDPKWLVVEEPTPQIRTLLDRAISQGVVVMPNQRKIKMSDVKIVYLVPQNSPETHQVVVPIKSPSVESVIEQQLQEYKQLLFPYLSQLVRDYYLKTIQTVQKLFTQNIRMPSRMCLAMCFCNILKAFLNKVQITNINDRGVQKLFSWCLFYTLAHRLLIEASVYQKFCRVYQDCIRFEHVKIANLCDVALTFGVPEGSFKPIKSENPLLKWLTSKVDYMRMNIDNGHSLILIGDSGSLKSSSIQELIQGSGPNHRFIRRTITPSLSLSSFLQSIQSQLRIKKGNGNLLLEPKGRDDCKLSIFVDNINANLDILNFVDGFASLRHKKLWVRSENRYIQVSDKLTLHGVLNQKRMFDPSTIVNLVPVMFKQDGQQVLSQLYKQTLESKVEVNLLQTLLETTLETIKSIRYLKHPSPFDPHDLSRFFQNLEQQKFVTKEVWVDTMVYVYCSPLNANRTEAITIIYKAFGVQTPSNMVETLGRDRSSVLNTIRVPMNKVDFHDRFDKLRLSNQNLVRVTDVSQLKQLLDSCPNTGTTLYISPSESKLTQQLELLNQCANITPPEPAKCTFILQLRSPQALQRVYTQYTRLVDKYFTVVYEDTPLQENMHEEAFRFFKGKVEINRDSLVEATSYYDILLRKNSSLTQAKISQSQRVLTCYAEHQEAQRLCIQSFGIKSVSLFQKTQREETLLNSVKSQNMNLVSLRQQISSKTQEANALAKSEGGIDEQQKLKQVVKELQTKLVALSKQLSVAQEQLRQNTKQKDALGNECASLEQVISAFQLVGKDLGIIASRAREQLVNLNYQLQNNTHSLCMRKAIKIAYLSKLRLQHRKQLMVEFKKEIGLCKSVQLLDEYIYLKGKVSIVFDPNTKALQNLQKFYPQLVTTHDKQKIPNLEDKSVLVVTLYEDEQELQQTIAVLEKSPAEKVVILLSYMPKKYPFLNYKKSVQDELGEIVLEVIDQYLKQTTLTSLRNLQSVRRDVSGRQRDCLKILCGSTKQFNADYLHSLNGKLAQLKMITQREAELDSEYTAYLKEASKYDSITECLGRFNTFVKVYLRKLSPVYIYGYAYMRSLVVNTLSRFRHLVQTEQQSFCNNVTEHLLSHILTSVRREHLTTVKFMWCQFKLCLPMTSTETLLEGYPISVQASTSEVLQKFNKECSHLSLDTLSGLRQIVQSKLSHRPQLQAQITEFVEKYYTYTHKFQILESSYYLLERQEIPTEDVAVEIFGQQDYQVFLVSGQSSGDQIIESQLTSNNLIVRLPSDKQQINNAYLKYLQLSKNSPERRYRIVFLTVQYEDTSVEMLSTTTKISTFQLVSTSDLREIITNKFNSLCQKEYTSLSVPQKVCYLATIITFSLSQLYCQRIYRVEYKRFKIYVSGILSSLSQGDSNSNAWLFTKIFQGLSLDSWKKDLLVVIFSRTLSDIQDIFGGYDKEAIDVAITLSIVKDSLPNYTLEYFGIPETIIQKLGETKQESIYSSLSVPSSQSPVGSDVKSLELLPVMEIPKEQYPRKSIQEMMYNQSVNFNKLIMQLNGHIRRYNNVVQKRLIIDGQYQETIDMVKRGLVPHDWLHFQTKREVSMQWYTRSLNNKIIYLTSILDSNFKVKTFSIHNIPKPIPVLKKLLQAEQKKTKFQNKVLFGKFLTSGNESVIEPGIILSSLTLKYCRYDPQRQSLEQTLEPCSPSPNILLTYGDLIPSLHYTKVPLYAFAEIDSENPLIMIDLPFRSKGQPFYSVPRLVVDNA